MSKEIPILGTETEVKDQNGDPVTISSFLTVSVPGGGRYDPERRIFQPTSAEHVYLLDEITLKWYVFNIQTEEYEEFQGNPLEDLPQDTSASLSVRFLDDINTFINRTALQYNYSSIDNAISYFNSGVVASREDASKFITWRDNTLSLMYDNIDNFLADGITLPTLDGFTSQAGYVEFTAIEPQNLFFGDENFGYKRFEDNTFIGWVNVQHNSQNSGLGQNIPLPDGEHVKSIYSINGIVDQGNLTSDWLSLDYTLKIKLNGSNIHNSPTNFDYKVQAINGVENVYEGLVLRFNIFGSF